MGSKTRLAVVVATVALSLTACGETYDNGGYGPTEAELNSPAQGSVTFSSLSPTRTEMEQAVSEVIVTRARALTELPHVRPSFTISCPALPPLEAGQTLPCSLKSSVVKDDFKDFTVTLTELSGLQAVLSVDTPSYWAYLNRALG